MAVLLCNLSDATQILKDARREWVYNILESLGIPDDVLYCDNLGVFRGYLVQHGLFVENSQNDEEIDIYKAQWHDDGKSSGWLPLDKKHLIAQWKRPKFIRKVEGKDVYYEIHLNEWSMIKTT